MLAACATSRLGEITHWGNSSKLPSSAKKERPQALFMLHAPGARQGAKPLS
jgi:hypothetical protein